MKNFLSGYIARYIEMTTLPKGAEKIGLVQSNGHIIYTLDSQKRLFIEKDDGTFVEVRAYEEGTGSLYEIDFETLSNDLTVAV
jgi:hypothetical protein